MKCVYWKIVSTINVHSSEPTHIWEKNLYELQVDMRVGTDRNAETVGKNAIVCPNVWYMAVSD